jgi:hypothetical protein
MEDKTLSIKDLEIGVCPMIGLGYKKVNGVHFILIGFFYISIKNITREWKIPNL